MFNATRFYINGRWLDQDESRWRDVVNPSDQTVAGHVALGAAHDVEEAVAAARKSFISFSLTSRNDRLALLEAIDAELQRRNDEIAEAISVAMGAPVSLARGAQAPSGTQHFAEAIRILRDYPFEERLRSTLLRREPVGVCALITPWNWPMNQIATKVAPALAAGCTMVLKPSELAQFDAVILAEIMDTVGVPAGVFNLIHGDGPDVGAPLCSHPDVDMVSFTGSTRAGIAISQAAAPTVKRVALELGGKSANILLDDADVEKAVTASVRSMMLNSGQSCNAPSRLIVPEQLYSTVIEVAARVAGSIRVGPAGEDVDMGPIANRSQYERVRRFIQVALDEGGELVAGGTGLDGLPEKGFYVKPTVFGRVSPAMTIAREEVFGPVLAIMTYSSLDEAIAIANDSEYGLSGYVWSADHTRAVDVARQLRTGMVHINGASLDSAAPFGGYKMSGNGREWGRFGVEEFLEVKSMYGAAA